MDTIYFRRFFFQAGWLEGIIYYFTLGGELRRFTYRFVPYWPKYFLTVYYYIHQDTKSCTYKLFLPYKISRHRRGMTIKTCETRMVFTPNSLNPRSSVCPIGYDALPANLHDIASRDKSQLINESIHIEQYLRRYATCETHVFLNKLIRIQKKGCSKRSILVAWRDSFSQIYIDSFNFQILSSFN